MYRCLQIMCAKYYELRLMFKKNCTSSKLACLLDTASKFALFSVYCNQMLLSYSRDIQRQFVVIVACCHIREYFVQISNVFLNLLLSSFTSLFSVHTAEVFLLHST